MSCPHEPLSCTASNPAHCYCQLDSRFVQTYPQKTTRTRFHEVYNKGARLRLTHIDSKAHCTRLQSINAANQQVLTNNTQPGTASNDVTEAPKTLPNTVLTAPADRNGLTRYSGTTARRNFWARRGTAIISTKEPVKLQKERRGSRGSDGTLADINLPVPHIVDGSVEVMREMEEREGSVGMGIRRVDAWGLEKKGSKWGVVRRRLRDVVGSVRC
jgi:hypothetical protein